MRDANFEFKRAYTSSCVLFCFTWKIVEARVKVLPLHASKKVFHKVNFKFCFFCKQNRLNFMEIYFTLKMITYHNIYAADYKCFHGRILFGCVSIEFSSAFVPFHWIEAITFHVIEANQFDLITFSNCGRNCHADIT